ncbi:MAG TPA: carbohydrate porin [Desulfobacteraceae bacterium]|nr:carbohydrate porin [Desulfobacteraceae bacterium]
MNRPTILVIAGLLVSLMAGPAFGEKTRVERDEMEAMKNKLEQLEKAIEKKTSPASADKDDSQWYRKMDVALGATGVLQRSSGVQKRLGPDGDTTAGSASFELELTLPVPDNGTFYSLFEAGPGDGIDGIIPTISGFNDTPVDDDNVGLAELWYEHTWIEKRLRFRVGKIDITTDFDTSAVANSSADQFLSGAFANNLVVEFPDDNGFGAMLWISPADIWGIGIGVADADAGWDKVTEDIFSIIELDLKPKIAGREGNYRIYGWFNGKDHENLLDPNKTKEDNYGFGLSFDQQITDTVTLFARYGRQRSSVSRVEQAWSAGLQFAVDFYGRQDDAFGLAYGQSVIGDAGEKLDRTNSIDTADEHHLEIYYNFKVNDHLNITPDIQWVKNPDGDRDNDDLWAFALRARLTF